MFMSVCRFARIMCASALSFLYGKICAIQEPSVIIIIIIIVYTQNFDSKETRSYCHSRCAKPSTKTVIRPCGDLARSSVTTVFESECSRCVLPTPRFWTSYGCLHTLLGTPDHLRLSAEVTGDSGPFKIVCRRYWGFRTN